MNPQSTFNFQWLSPLGLSVALFLLYGAIYLLIGVLTPIMVDSSVIPGILIISGRPDTVVFGDTPEHIRQTNPILVKLRSIILKMLAGMLVAAGVMVVALAWFGLRQGQAWALGTLAVAGVAVLPIWYLVLRPYFVAGVSLGLGDLPPFMWVPAALLLPAVILGWIGLR
jgi:hypothetical protein